MISGVYKVNISLGSDTKRKKGKGKKMKQTLKKGMALLLTLVMMLSLAACGTEEKKPEAEKKQEESGDKPAEKKEAKEEAPAEKKKVALICDVAGTQVFILDMIDGFNKSAEKYGFEPIVAECGDPGAFEDQMRAILEEGVDLMIGGGWQATDGIQKMATEFPDKADYAIIDVAVEAPNVKCITFREQEGAYLIGKIAAMSSPEDQKMFGGVHVFDSAGSFKWRWGFMEGVKSIRPDAEFVFNFTGSFNDPAKAKELALQQYEQGCAFINGASAGGDKGVFEAAKEKGFFTSGQDVDLTTPDNPYIITSQLKNTGATMEKLLDDYFAPGWTTDDETYGVKEGAIGAVYVTADSETPRNPVLTDDDIKELKATADKIASGELELVVPKEEDYEK